MRTITLTGLATKRAAAGMTQQALADKLGILRSNIANWETGQSLPLAALLPALAEALGCTIDELFRAPEPAAERQDHEHAGKDAIGGDRLR